MVTCGYSSESDVPTDQERSERRSTRGSSEHDQEQFTAGRDVLCGRVELLVRRAGQAAAANKADAIAEMAGWYKPGHFDSSTFYLIASSHNDIAYLDDPKGTADFRAENLIGPALDLMKIDNSFALDVESTLFLKEYLERCPERIDEVRQRVAEKRLSFGGRYTQFYEAVYGGEALARQMYFGRKWLKKTLGGDCDTQIVWDTDIPQRTLQSPQVFAKAGIKYLMIGRFPTPGVFVWESPDGSNVIFDTYLYGSGWGLIPGGAAVPAGTPTTKYVFDLLESQRPLFEAVPPGQFRQRDDERLLVSRTGTRADGQGFQQRRAGPQARQGALPAADEARHRLDVPGQHRAGQAVHEEVHPGLAEPVGLPPPALPRADHLGGPPRLPLPGQCGEIRFDRQPLGCSKSGPIRALASTRVGKD